MFKVYTTHLADVCFGALKVVQDMIPIFGNEMTAKIMNAISPLFVSTDRNMRLCLCDLLDTLAEVDPSVSIVVMLAPFLYFT